MVSPVNVALDDAGGAGGSQFDLAEVASDPVHQLGVALGNRCSEMSGVVVAHRLVNGVRHLLTGTTWVVTWGHGDRRSRIVVLVWR